ncbi:MAG TPA: glutamate 5-kinase, partial [Actinomycetota bacterium]|nr:glutamate 5-kinase [Actinomycetota bacterium]
MSRSKLSDARRVVVKVGTSSLTDPEGHLDRARVERFANELCDLADAGRELVCVSSGAISAGLGPLGLSRRPTDTPTLQAAAAVGQSHLMDAYASAFEARGRACGQVLLTKADITHRHAYVNALNTFRRLIALGAVPVVNENDTVATHDIRFGENDLLAALVANLVEADALVLLSDVDGLHEGVDGPLVTEVEAITPEVERLAAPSRPGLGSGGMPTKLAAAKVAAASGIPVVIARSGPGVLSRVLSGGPEGTLFHAAPAKMAKRKAWIAFAATPRGRIVVDTGARRALV